MEKEVKEAYDEFEDTVKRLSIEERDKCVLMDMAKIVSVVSRQKDYRLQTSKLYFATKEYAIRFAQLSDNVIVKLLSSVFLEDK